MKRMQKQYGLQHRPNGHSAIRSGVLYWKQRSITIKYLIIMLIGIFFASMYASAAGTEALPCKILQQQLESLPGMNLWQAVQDKLLFSALGIAYLMVSGACLWGRWLTPLLPFLFGIEQGTVITDLLLIFGFSGWKYLILAKVLPAALECFVWLLLCNHAHKCCEELRGNSSMQKGKKGGMWIFGGVLLLALSVLESVMQIAFT